MGLGCAPNGDGQVSANFDPAECPPGTENSELRDYGWDAQYLATERYFQALIINIQKYRVDIFETDSLGIRLDIEGLESAGLITRDGQYYRLVDSPVEIEIGPERDQSQVILSLFRTCSDLPGFSAVSGRVIFDEFRIRIDGENTGDRERLVGRVLDGQLSYSQAPAPIASFTASFDFEPPYRPLRESK